MSIRIGSADASMEKATKEGVDGCLYVNKLADVDLAVLEQINKLGVGSLRSLAPEKNRPVRAQ
jgi:hypothetical protein